MVEERIETKLRKVEKDLHRDAVELFDELNLSKGSKLVKILETTGPTKTKILGKKLKEGIEKISRYEIKGFVIQQVDSPTITNAIEYAQKENVAAVVSRGSGKACDAAKYIGYILRIPYINIPSAPTNDAIASPLVVIKDEKGFPPHSIRAFPPYAVLIDEDQIAEAPIDLVRLGIGDLSDKILANYEWALETKLYKEGKNEKENIEALYDKKISEMCVNAQKSTYNIFMEMRKITGGTGIPFGYSHPQWKKGVLALTYALCQCGKAMGSIEPYSSRPCSGSGHAYSHALDMILPNPEPHGLEVAEGSRIAHLLLEKCIGEKPFGMGYNELTQILEYTGTAMKWKGIKGEEKKKYMVKGVVKAKELSRGRPRLTEFNYLEDFHKPKISIDYKFVREIIEEILI